MNDGEVRITMPGVLLYPVTLWLEERGLALEPQGASNDFRVVLGADPSDQVTAVMQALLKARLAAGLSQTDIAVRCGVSQSKIARSEAGNTEPPAGLLFAYADALGLRLRWELEEKR